MHGIEVFIVLVIGVIYFLATNWKVLLLLAFFAFMVWRLKRNN